MPQTLVFFARWKWLATALSVLSLWSALLAPAAALAKDVGEGRWFGVCSAAHADQLQPDAPGDGHCGLCLLSGPALLPSAVPGPQGGRIEAVPMDWSGRGCRSIAMAGPFIRGPPTGL